MRTLKLSFQFFLFVLFLQTAKAQIVYRDLSPDQTLQMPAESLGKMPLYLDDDTSLDATLVFNNYPAFGFWNVAIRPTDTLNPKVEFLYNSNLPKSPVGDYYILPLDLNQNIGSTASYASYYPQIGDSYNSNFRGMGDKYIGFRIKTGNSYKYGWMKIDFSGDNAMTFILKELAYQNTENTAIKAGQKFGVGIRHLNFEQNAFTMYPNPVKSTLHIQSNGALQTGSVRIYTPDGRCVSELNAVLFPLYLEVGELAKGLYYIEILQGEHPVARELILKEN